MTHEQALQLVIQATGCPAHQAAEFAFTLGYRDASARLGVSVATVRQAVTLVLRGYHERAAERSRDAFRAIYAA